MKLMRLFSPALLALLLAPPAVAQDAPQSENAPANQPAVVEEAAEQPAEAAAEPAEAEAPATEPAATAQPQIPVQVETVVSGLTNPSGVAVQPRDDQQTQVYVSDSGAQRVVKFDAQNPSEVQPVITDFPKDIYGKGPKYDIGPLGLAFINQDTLVVGGGGQPDGEELLRVYALPQNGGPIKAEDMKTALGPIKPGEQSKSGEGNFYGVAVTPQAIYVTSNGDDTKGWVAKAELTGDTASSYGPYIATKEATGVDAPVGVAINRKGHIVIGQMGEISLPGDSLLTFYSPKTGKMLMNLETGLHDIVALAYSPTGRLYALDFAWLDTKQGALYRLDDDGMGGVRTVKVTDLDKPTAMAFAPDGTLYVTVFGTADDGSTQGSGQVLKITGKL